MWTSASTRSEARSLLPILHNWKQHSTISQLLHDPRRPAPLNAANAGLGLPSPVLRQFFRQFAVALVPARPTPTTRRSLPDNEGSAVALVHHSGRSCDEFPRTFSLSSFLFGFSISAGPCDEFPRTPSRILSLLVDAGCSMDVTASCDEDEEDVGEDELEELLDRPGTTNGT